MGIKPLILAQVETEASSGLAIDIDDEDDVQEIEWRARMRRMTRCQYTYIS